MRRQAAKVMSSSYEEEARRRPKGRNLRPLLRLTPFLRNYRPQMAMAFLALLAAAGATLAVPVAIRRIIDNGFSSANAELVDRYFFAMMAVVLVLAIGSALRFYFVMWIGERVVADVRDALFAHLLKLSPGFFETQRTARSSRASPPTRHRSRLPSPPPPRSRSATS